MLEQYIDNNPFLKSRIGHRRFADFAKNHLSYLKANNKDKLLDEIIAIIEDSIVKFVKWNGDQDTSTTSRSSKTDSLDKILDDFMFFMNSVWKEVKYTFEGTNREVFLQCFPNGKSEYNNILRTEAPILLKRVADFCVAHSGELKKGLADDASLYLASYIAKRDEQKEDGGIVKDGSNEGTTLRNTLAINMKEVLLKLLLIYKKNESEVYKFYDAEIINSHTKKPAPKPIIPPAV